MEQNTTSGFRENYQNSPSGAGGAKDPQLWELAQKRASFKSHLAVYIVVNLFLWLLWYFTGAEIHENDLPWPIWPTLGWGIGVAFHYIGAYVTAKNNLVEKEYEKLMQEKSNKNQ